jgi:predicted AlkP superfamily phosphohydrolase/phosphomutase
MTENDQLNCKAEEKDRVIVVGLDSADPDLVQRWLQEGRLPFMRSLIESGAWARLGSTAGLFPDSPWPSFNTGVQPGKHGFYNYLQFKRGTADIVRADARFCRYPPFWAHLRSPGKNVAIFDMPKIHPIEGINGSQVAGWGEHYPLLKQCSLPLPLAKELTARFGKYRHPKEVVNPKRTSREVRLYNILLRNIERKFEATQFLMAQQDWELFVTAFSEAHYAGHEFYHHFDRHHWAYDPERAKDLGNTLPNTYAELDSALAGLLKGRLDRATVFLVSVHGIETNYSANYLMPTVLEKLGFQAGASNVSSTTSSSKMRDWSRPLRELIPGSVREFINDNIVPQSFHDKVFSCQFSSSIDWQRTKAFFVPSDHFQGFISINLKGREPWGVVWPGKEYEEACSQLCYELQRLVNPETGKPAVEDAVQISKIYAGENLYLLPDVVVCWAKDGPIRQLYHPAFGKIAAEDKGLRKSGHSADGFMIAAGRHIHRGAAIQGAHTTDLAPTILYLLGEAVPDQMDGKVLWDLIDADFKANNPVKNGSSPNVSLQQMGA